MTEEIKITVRVKPGSSQARVVESETGEFIVSTRARPVEGKANSEVVELLAEHFGVAKRNVEIMVGNTGRNKVVRIKIAK